MSESGSTIWLPLRGSLDNKQTVSRISFLLLLLLFFCGRVLFAQTVFVKPDEALRLVFHDSKEVVTESRTLSFEQKSGVEKKLGDKISKDTWKFFVAKTGDRVDGYALIDNEVGKTEPITFLTALTPDGRVKSVEILVYREPHGSEVSEKRFLKQYEKKSASDPLTVGQDITNMSGATLSSRGVTRGVKRDVLIWEAVYGKK